MYECNSCGWNGYEDELICTDTNDEFVHCPRCESDDLYYEEEEGSVFCEDCGWDGEDWETDLNGYCPECGGEVYPNW